MSFKTIGMRIVLAWAAAGCLAFGAKAIVAASTTAPATAPAADFSHTWLLHLPGIGGELPVDHALINGLKDAGWSGPTRIYDWTEHDPGLDALLARKRNEREAEKVERGLERRLREDPSLSITLTSHSAGTGIAVWALEKLPPDMKVQTLVLMAPALSPGYDLSKALSHVRGRAYVFSSEFDVAVLGTGTSLFGTVDGVKTRAAGLLGFKQPPGADPAQYAKLVPMPYDKAWMKFGNIGDHIGCMGRAFVRYVVAPRLIHDLGARDATTQPADGGSHDDR